MKRSEAVSTVGNQAEQLRHSGNVCFKKERYGAAIDAYTEAITLCPNVAVYWTNRALCHRRRNDWKRVEEDCRRAIELDHSSVKAHYMLGLALLQEQNYADGVKELQKALDLGRGTDPSGYMVEEIWQELGKAKYMEWEHESSKRSWELQSLKETCVTALREKHFVDDATVSNAQQFQALERVFRKAAEEDTPTEVLGSSCCLLLVCHSADTYSRNICNDIQIPDYLCCKITLDIFRDPVITPSGMSYERAVILEHLEKVGRFDPVTHERLSPSQLVPNLAIKEAVQAYLEKHGWAYQL